MIKPNSTLPGGGSRPGELHCRGSLTGGRGLSPSRAPRPGRRAPRASGSEGRWGFIARAPGRVWGAGDKRLHSHRTRTESHAPGARAGAELGKILGQPYLQVWEGLRSQGSAAHPVSSRSWELLPLRAADTGLQLDTAEAWLGRQPAGAAAGTGQATNWAGTRPPNSRQAGQRFPGPTAASACGPDHQRAQDPAPPTVPESPAHGPAPSEPELGSAPAPLTLANYRCKKPAVLQPVESVNPELDPLADQCKLPDTLDPVPRCVRN